jgi:hypothetical protein
MSHYEIKIKLILESEDENTARVQMAITDYLNTMQRYKQLLTTTKDAEFVRLHSWEPIRD